MSESESALESDDEEQGLTVVPSSKAKRGARAAVGGGAAAGRSDTCNEAAILRKLEQLRGGVDTESDDAAWLETLDITASEPVELDDAEEGQRELAFYTQALAAVKSAQARLTKMDVPFARPDDYFAEMLKTDQHMAKVKLRLIKQQEAVFNAEQRRKQQHNKKFGKQVQRAKLEERARQKTAESHAKTDMRKERKANQSAPEFDIKFDGGDDAPRDAKRARTDGGGKGGARGDSGAGKGKGKGSKREAKEAKFGKARFRKDKTNDADSSFDTRHFNKGPKAKAKGGKGGGKGGKGGAIKKGGKKR